MPIDGFYEVENILDHRTKHPALINHSLYGILETRGSNISEIIRETRVIESHKSFIMASELERKKLEGLNSPSVGVQKKFYCIPYNCKNL